MTYTPGQHILVYPLRRVAIQRVAHRLSGVWVRYENRWHRASSIEEYRDWVMTRLFE